MLERFVTQTTFSSQEDFKKNFHITIPEHFNYGYDVVEKDVKFSVEFSRTKDILAYLGEHKTNGQFLCGFSMETKDLIENSSAKLINKNADMIVANDLTDEGSGFGTDTNRVTFITKDGIFPQELQSDRDRKSVV